MALTHFQSRTRLRGGSRLGAATVELAICLPFLAAAVFGSIELANGLYTKQSLTSAAYEAAQVVTSTGGTETEARARAQAVLTSQQISNTTITITPTVNSSTASGTRITVKVEATMSGNTAILWFLSAGTKMTAQTTMVRL